VPAEIAGYNRSHNLVGSDSVKMTETWRPSGDNEWTTRHTIFDNKAVVVADGQIRAFCNAFQVGGAIDPRIATGTLIIKTE
jgi:hypothetical protein